MLDKLPLNTALLSHWQNWARVLLMVVIGFMAFDLISRRLNITGKEQ